MLRVLRGLFSLESRFNYSLINSATKFNADIKNLEKRIVDATKQLDTLESKINARLSRLEVLFADELAVKELARDELVKAKRLEATRGH